MAVSRKAMTEGIRTPTFLGTLNNVQFDNPSVKNQRFLPGVVSLRAPMGQNSQNIQCHCEPVTDVTGVAIPRIGVKSKIS